MTRRQALDIFERVVTEALAGEPTARVRVADRNVRDADAPTGRTALRLAHVHVVVPMVTRSTDSLGQGTERSSTGAAMIHVTVAKGEGDERAQRLAEAITDHLETDADPDLDVWSVTDGPTGERWGGTWWGVSLAVEFHLVTPDNQRARST